MELTLIQYVGSIGGVAGVLALVIFFMYRQMVSQMRDDRKFMEDRLTGILKDYNDVCVGNRDALVEHTRVQTELIIWLKAKNGNSRS